MAILDHHKTSQFELANIKDKYKLFRMDHCGAYLTWCFMHRTNVVPLLIKYVEDNDIWLKQMPKTCEFTSFINTIDHKFELYENFLNENYILNTALIEGSVMMKQNNHSINKFLEKANIKIANINQKYYMIAYVNSAQHKSEIGNQLIKKYPLIDFSAIYSIDDIKNKTIFSLRSTDDNCDVSKIAKIFNGGGHMNASGCIIDNITNVLPYTIMDGIDLYNSLKTLKFINNFKISNDDNISFEYKLCLICADNNKCILANYLLQEKNKKQNWCNIIKRLMNVETDDYVYILIVYSKNENYRKYFVTLDTTIGQDHVDNIINYLSKDTCEFIRTIEGKYEYINILIKQSQKIENYIQ